MILTVKKCEYFIKKGFKKTYQPQYRIEKVIKKKGNELCIKWKDYDNSFNSCIDKKDGIDVVI